MSRRDSKMGGGCLCSNTLTLDQDGALIPEGPF